MTEIKNLMESLTNDILMCLCNEDIDDLEMLEKKIEKLYKNNKINMNEYYYLAGQIEECINEIETGSITVVCELCNGLTEINANSVSFICSECGNQNNI